MIRFLKTMVFVIICLFVFSTGYNRNTYQDSFHHNELSSEVQVFHAQAILTSITDGEVPCPPISRLFQNLVNSNIIIADYSRYINQRLVTLRKNRELIKPILHHGFHNPVVFENADDLPDLS